MRRILIERARRKVTAKRAGFQDREELDEEHLEINGPSEEALAVDEALDLLEKEDKKGAALVKLRFFVGMSMKEASEALDLPLRSAERLWTFCKVFLKNSIRESQTSSTSNSTGKD